MKSLFFEIVIHRQLPAARALDVKIREKRVRLAAVASADCRNLTEPTVARFGGAFMAIDDENFARRAVDA